MGGLAIIMQVVKKLGGIHMTTQEIFEKLVNEIHTTVIASNDLNGNPVTSVIDMMLTENEKLYFLTAKGKKIYERLMRTEYVALSGMKGADTMSTVAVSVHGKVRNIGKEKLNEIFQKNSYMEEIYPEKEARSTLEVFEIYEGAGELFDLSCKPIYRKSFSFGNAKAEEYGFFISEKCKGCASCSMVCPQNCIVKSDKIYKINQEHCLHCGKCIEVCPYDAILKCNNWLRCQNFK